jgi:hypothetical protein
MPADEAVNELQALDAIASEQDAVLAFRICDESTAFEPVFLRMFRANVGEENETALLAISDERGMSLGRFVINREQLELALDRAEAIDEDDPEDDGGIDVVPLEWEQR